MDVFTMVVVIVVIGCVTSSLDNWVKHKGKAVKNTAQDKELAFLKDEVAYLKDRVRVLEKLATDEDVRLRDEFRRMA